MPEPDLGVPNLDDCPNSDRDSYCKVFHSLSTYCTVKSWAASNRAKGDIETAQMFEQECELIYRALPDWARW